MTWDKMTDTEKNALVAKEVMGLQVCDMPHGEMLKECSLFGVDKHLSKDDPQISHYTTDISSAMEVWDKLIEDGFVCTLWQVKNGFNFQVWESGKFDCEEVANKLARTRSEAISKAALVAKGVSI